MNITFPLNSSDPPFGMGIVGREWMVGGQYRFGFNGKESDNEVSGNGNIYDYGFRIYNSRLGRFLSTDPIKNQFPWYTPYQFAGNKPIFCLDLDGFEEIYYGDELVSNFANFPALEVLNNTEVAGDYLKRFQDKTINNNSNWLISPDNKMPNGGGVTFTIPAEVLFYAFYVYAQGAYVKNQEYMDNAIADIKAYTGGNEDQAELILKSQAAKNSVTNSPETAKQLQITFLGTGTSDGQDINSVEDTGFKDLQGNNKNNLWTNALILGHEFIAHVGYLIVDKWPDNEDGEHNRFESDDKNNPEKIHTEGESESIPVDILPSRPGSMNSDGAKLFRETKKVIDKLKEN
ncbi:MAG: RHS repeat-associated core domain-containing protein [Chitinophagales bacterium]